MNTFSLFAMSERELHYSRIQIDKPGVLTNIDYPFHYARGSAWLWEIYFGHEKYVNIFFLNISLNIYKVMFNDMSQLISIWYDLAFWSLYRRQH